MGYGHPDAYHEWATSVRRMARKNLKVPESLFSALRDDKPDHMSWPAYLETRCLDTDDVSHPSPGGEVSEQLDRIESAAQTAEKRTGRIEQALDDMGARR